jgi:hypothetical protein
MAAAQAADDPAEVLLVARDWLGVVAADTGRVLRERRLTGTPAREFGYADPIVDDLVLLRHGTPGVDGTLIAYSRRTLAPVWQRDEPVEDGSPYYCSDVLCELAGNRVTVLDPATGQPRWDAGGNVTLTGRGPDVIETTNGLDKPLRVRDRATGAIHADLRRWTWYSWGLTDGPLVLGHPAEVGTVFGALRPGTGAVQPLGHSPNPVGECHSDDRYIACRTSDGITTWSYLS